LPGATAARLPDLPFALALPLSNAPADIEAIRANVMSRLIPRGWLDTFMLVLPCYTFPTFRVLDGHFVAALIASVMPRLGASDFLVSVGFTPSDRCRTVKQAGDLNGQFARAVRFDRRVRSVSHSVPRS
jgi:hypothetical protein